MTRFFLSITLILSTACATTSQVNELKKQLAEERAARVKLEEQAKAAPPSAVDQEEIQAMQMGTDLVPPVQPGTIMAYTEVPRHCKAPLAAELTNATDDYIRVALGGRQVILRGVSGWQADMIPPHKTVYVCMQNLGQHTVEAKRFGQRVLALDARGNAVGWEPVEIPGYYRETANWDGNLPSWRERHHHEIKKVRFRKA
ncbi:hypothetical protein HY633_01895 [Candidatus Uhrbacteria bacterium]|nr:hypothetical protein [Candidatus Uhrbacteria bacterium]